MWSKLFKMKTVLVMALAIAVIAAMACAGEEEEEEPTTVPAAPAPTTVPAAPAPTTVPAAPAAPAAAPAVALGIAADPAPEGFTEGEYWVYDWDGPMPTEFHESPRLAALVQQGKLPPLEERVPTDPMVVHVANIGTYGGIWRVTATTVKFHEGSLGMWGKRDSNGIMRIEHFGYADLSEDGKVYTMKLRDGVKWSDGEPVTMEDIRFAWEDNNLNPEAVKALPATFKDSVTGNTVTFNVVDDMTWTLTYDSPMYTLWETRRKSGAYACPNAICWLQPAHYDKQFHPNYADATELEAKIADEGFGAGDWAKLMYLKTNHWIVGRPSISPYIIKVYSEDYREYEGNPFYYVVDQAGNQLPYADGVARFRVESRDVAVFRAMSGETDAWTVNFMLMDLPLLRANAEKGDYRVFLWPNTGGNDVGWHFNQTYNEDPEIGMWVRTKEFRRALSLTVNRTQINEVAFLGLGTIQQWIPHPATHYYPGYEVGQQDIEHDVATANQILDSLGLDKRDEDGNRLRLDGTGPLELMLVYGTLEDAKIAPMLQQDFKDIGIKMSLSSSGAYNTALINNEAYMGLSIDMSCYHANPWMIDWIRLAPIATGMTIAPSIAEYFSTNGEKGMAPTGPDPAYMPQAPAGTYPADASGNLKKLQDLWVEGREYRQLDPRRIELGKEIFSINADEKYSIGIVGFTATRRGVMVNRNNLNNVPPTHIRDKHGFWTETYYFEDGKDNMGT